MPIASVNVLVSRAITWLSWSSCPYADALAVFRFELTAEVMAVVQPTQLQPNELDRANRYRQLIDRNRFMYARHLMRLLLSWYCRQTPDTIHFTTDINGKPQLTHTDDWHINVSHAGNWVLVAVGKNSVGIDVEQVKLSFTFQDLLLNSFSAPEQQHIQGDANPRLAFYELWTRKEALVKATGKGIGDDFVGIPSLMGTHTPDSQLIGATGDWMVQSFTVAEDYVAALACVKTAVIPKFYTIDGGFFAPFTS